MNRQKIYASLLILGACILIFRALRLLTYENGWIILASWVVALTLMEMAIDALCVIFSFRWLFTNSELSKTRSLRWGAAAALSHALRVLVYVLGRTEAFLNFDVKPPFRPSHSVDLFWVYFAATGSVLGVVGVIVIWMLIKKRTQNP